MTFTSAKAFIVSAIVIGLFGFTEYGQNFMTTHNLDTDTFVPNDSVGWTNNTDPNTNSTYCNPIIVEYGMIGFDVIGADVIGYYTSYDTETIKGCIVPPLYINTTQDCDNNICMADGSIPTDLSYKTHGYTLVEFVLSFWLIALFYVWVPHVLFNKLYMITGITYHQTAAWNTVSMLVLSYVTMFCYYMIKNVFAVFYSELSDTPKLDTIAECNAFPKTRYMIESMDFEQYSSKVMHICLLISAYFAYDIIMNRPRKEYMVHHLISMACIAVYWFTHSYVFYICCGIFTEVSTVFLSMSGLAQSDSSIKKIMLGEFALVFFVCRILFIPLILMLNYCIESGFRFGIITVAYLAVYALNVMWCSQIARKVMRR